MLGRPNKRRNEVCRVGAALKLAYWDRNGSGLDIDALKGGVSRREYPARRTRAIVLGTHTAFARTTIVPDQVHVVSGGRLMKIRGQFRSHMNSNCGYDWV